MTGTDTISFFARIPTAFACFFRVLGDGAFAARVSASTTPALPSSPAPTKPTEPTSNASESDDGAVALLALLQREGRLIDFLMQSIDGYSDQDVGAAARHVHDGCRKALRSVGDVAPVAEASEGERVTLPEEHDSAAYKLTGDVPSKGPYTGKLVHRGWRAGPLRLPRSVGASSARVLAQAELEL